MRLLRTAALLVASGIWIGGCGSRTNLSDLSPRAGGGGTSTGGKGGGAGACCSPHEEPGCGHSAIEECVCEFDPTCCTASWSGACALIVDLAECGDCSEASGGTSSTGGLSAVGGHGAIGGQQNTGGIAPNIGGQIPNAGGVIAAGGQIPSTGGVSPGGGPSSGGASNSCCGTSSTPGCGDPEVERCVCEDDRFCCTLGWDEQCMRRAQSECGACGGGAGGSGGIGGFPGTGGVIAAGGQGVGGSFFPVCSSAFGTDCGNCLCSSCPSQISDCVNNADCREIFVCAALTGCRGFDCLREETCASTIRGNIEALNMALELVVCSGSSGCDCF